MNSGYSLDDTQGDTSFSKFNINRVPSYLFTVLQDIKSINHDIKIHLNPWSPVCPLLCIFLLQELNFVLACMDERHWLNGWWKYSISICEVLCVISLYVNHHP